MSGEGVEHLLVEILPSRSITQTLYGDQRLKRFECLAYGLVNRGDRATEVVTLASHNKCAFRIKDVRAPTTLISRLQQDNGKGTHSFALTLTAGELGHHEEKVFFDILELKSGQPYTVPLSVSYFVIDER